MSAPTTSTTVTEPRLRLVNALLAALLLVVPIGRRRRRHDSGVQRRRSAPRHGGPVRRDGAARLHPNPPRLLLLRARRHGRVRRQ